MRRDDYTRQQEEVPGGDAAPPDVARVQSMKVLGVTINCNLSVLDHVNNITRSSAQTIHALRILRAHGMADSSLHVVYRAVVVAGLTYAASAWWGCASAADRQRIEAVLRRGLIEMYAFK